MRSGIGGDDAKIRVQLSRRVSAYPIIIIICYLPYTIKGVLEVSDNFNKFNYEYNFTMVAGAIRCLIGLCNAIAYGFTKNVRKRVYYIFHKEKNVIIRGTLLAEISK